MSLKKIDGKIRTIATSAAKLNGLIHETAVMIASHALEHGDCTRALTLVNAMPASMRRTMLVLWFNTFTPIRVNLSTDKVGMLKAEAKGFTPFDIDGGTAKPFYELAEENPEAEMKDLNALIAMVAALAKQIDKKIGDGLVPDEDIPSAMEMSRRIAKLHFARVVPVAAANVDVPVVVAEIAPLKAVA